ncbi:MAG: 3-deoxy-D-manno-octulosonic acid transferase [Dissulfurispiraceae bacterium]|jgi:3-deoxy-D-manno-octulosonic-acid transferase|nr:3-deoxy-D-manno-octulosonic acid transferase [Dissulfurispiraceae bacterium]
MFPAYTILYTAALILLLPFEWFKRSAALRSRWLAERFGFVQSHASQKSVMIHAVSVGEVIASEPLIKRLKSDNPELNIVLSTVTDTGQKVAQDRVGSLAKIIYVPFDLPCAVNRMLDVINPQLFIVMETEFWPNLLISLKHRNIPSVLMNGRISERSFRGYRKLRFFFRPLLRMFSLLCVQTEMYADRLNVLGADHESLVVTGSLKFDTRPSEAVPEWTMKLKGTTIIGGSTHDDEEQLLIGSFSRLIKKYPDINLVLAPRHPERFDEAVQLSKASGLKYIRRSGIGCGHPDIKGAIIILDVMGELSSVYAACSIAVMGGSFIEHGGQNLLEPAYYSKAIVCGPHMDNFPFARDFYAEDAAVHTDRQGLTDTLEGLIASPEKIKAMGNKAKELYDKNSGALERSIKAIKKYL